MSDFDLYDDSPDDKNVFYFIFTLNQATLCLLRLNITVSSL